MNNAVCFEIPAHVLAHWNAELGAGLAEPRLQASFERVREAVGVTEQPAPALMPGGSKFERGVKQLGLEFDWGIVEANIAGCLGCGYCNIGCAYGAKLSMTETMLPRAQERWPERLRIVSECYVEKIERRNGGVSGVECRSGRRRVRVEANTVIVSAGAVELEPAAAAQRDRRAARGPRPVLQHGLADHGRIRRAAQRLRRPADLALPARAREQGYVMETWFNPPAAQAHGRARLARPAPPQHEPLSAPNGARRAGGDRGERVGAAPGDPRVRARLHARATATSAKLARGAQAGRARSSWPRAPSA